MAPPSRWEDLHRAGDATLMACFLTETVGACPLNDWGGLHPTAAACLPELVGRQLPVAEQLQCGFSIHDIEQDGCEQALQIRTRD